MLIDSIAQVDGRCKPRDSYVLSREIRGDGHAQPSPERQMVDL